MIPEFVELLDRIKTIHEKKNRDYSSRDGFDNFERSAIVASWFNDPIDKSFAILIGTKLARLANLLNKQETPNNESIQDSFDDATNYCALWGAYHAYRQKEALKLSLAAIHQNSEALQDTKDVENPKPIQSVNLCTWCAQALSEQYCIWNGKDYHAQCLIKAYNEYEKSNSRTK